MTQDIAGLMDDLPIVDAHHHLWDLEGPIRYPWLEKADPNSINIQISLSAARGEKALADGQLDLAAEQLRMAIAGYEKLPKDSASLNNCGLVYFHLYEITGDLKDHDRGLALLDEAVALEPGNSVLLINTASQLIDRAYMDIVGDAIRFGQFEPPPAAAPLVGAFLSGVIDEDASH